MRCKRSWRWAVAAVVVLGGCGGSDSDGPAPAVKTHDQPTDVVREFLEAVRAGDDQAATALLSPVAREKLLTGGGPLTPPASDTATFEVGQVETISTDEARVACTWTDLDAEGQPQSDRAVWHVRKGAEGWKVTGVAYKVFEDAPAVVLNFEDPEDMTRQRQWVAEEDRRRAIEAQAQAAATSEVPLRR